MVRYLFFFLFVLPSLLFGEVIETFYGSLDVTEPVILELVKSPTFQRLKKIHQYGVSYYAQAYSEEFTRYDHSLGVFAILRLKGRPLQEQVAGLLHDVSHTVFSHVGDWIFSKENQEKDYQNTIHQRFLERSELGRVLTKHNIAIASILPTQENVPALEQHLPDLCADRIDYNIQGAFHQHLITKKEGLELLESLDFVEGRWVCSNPELVEKIVRFSIAMSKNCWGSPLNDVQSRWLADVLLKGVEIGLITENDIHFGTDESVWAKLCSSTNPFIVNRMRALEKRGSLIEIVSAEAGADRIVRSKFRGIDPLIVYQGKVVRLTEINPKLAHDYLSCKLEMQRGWGIKLAPGAPSDRYQGSSLKLILK